MDTALIKTIHITSVALSYSLFFVRGVWMLRESPLVQARWVKRTRDSVDTVLLLSAITLAWQLGYSPLQQPWLAAKIIALLAYIVIGSVAMKRGKTKRSRLSAWLLAQGVFLYIVSVAVTHEVMPWNAL